MSAAGSSAAARGSAARDGIRGFLACPATATPVPGASTLAALALAALLAASGLGRLSAILPWCCLVGASEVGVAAVEHLFERRIPPDARLRAWAWAKTAAVAGHGLAWGIGPALLRVPGDPLATVATAWALPAVASVLAYACAGFPPCIVLADVAVLAPSALALGLWGSRLDGAVALGLVAALPVAGAIGLLAARDARAAALAQGEIASLLSRMRAAQRERATFYSTASHDLRQPVHALGLYAATLRATEDPGRRREIEGRLVECAASLDRQFNAILGVTLADRAAERADPRPVAVQRILDAVEASVLPEAARKGLRLRAVRSGLGVLADADALERVVLNLAGNAVRYTARGGVVIGARPVRGAVRIVVADSGIGIAEHQRGRIFDDFYQVEDRGRPREGGFGLGLAIVRRLCSAMGWALDLASVEGRGSVFSLVVPAAASAPAEAAERDFDGAPAPTVLLVDDDALVRDATAVAFERWNVPALVCADGAAAFAALATRRPGDPWHALIDFRLGGGEDGLDLARRLCAAAGPAFRVTLMSGDRDPAMVGRAASLGIAVLEKPLKPVRLRALLASGPDAAAG